ncbi:MAG: hypothetical protein WB615_04485 [Candidatus Tumulicola sp.]
MIHLIAALLALGGTAPESSPPEPVRHLQYRFGWNAEVADTGPYTGTLSVDLQPPTSDGSVTATATELWWNTIRPTATDTCQIYPNGGITCSQRPYSLSPMSLTLFPLLASNYFDVLAGGVSTWKRDFELTKGLGIWDCDFTLNGKGPISGSPQLNLIEAAGTITPHVNHSVEETVDVTTRIAYDPIAKLPVLVNQELKHNHNQPRSLETVQLKLTKSSP